MYSRDVSTASDPNLFQSCKKRKILHEIFYIKIAKWTSKSKNYRMTNKKGSGSYRNYTSNKIYSKHLREPFHELKIYTASKNFTRFWIAQIAAFCNSGFELLCDVFFKKYESLLPLDFILGFYVTQAAVR